MLAVNYGAACAVAQLCKPVPPAFRHYYRCTLATAPNRSILAGRDHCLPTIPRTAYCCVCVWWGGGLFTARPSFAWLRQDRTRKDPILGTLKSLGTKDCYGHRSTSCHFQQRAPLRYTSRTRTMLAVLWNYPARIVTECLAFGTVTSTAVSPFADWDNQGILDNRECTF